jgi:uncharacterized membrane protein YccC
MLRKQLAAIILALWLTIVFVIMLFLERFDLVEFFVLGLIGILVIVELIEPTYVQPGYLRYVKYLIAVGIVIFGMVVVQVAMETLGLVFVCYLDPSLRQFRRSPDRNLQIPCQVLKKREGIITF